MKTKLILFLAFFCMGTSVAFAQITTGKPSSKVIRTGNRPGAGDFGIYLGVTSDILKGLDKDVSVKALPLLNFKYMMTDHAELRLGLELYKSTTRVKGNKLENLGDREITIPTSDISSSSNALLYPSASPIIFSSKNILDVYVGAELPFGWDSSTSRTADGTPEMGENETITIHNFSKDITKRSFVIGLGAFVGLQAFIADLPLALGAEFGISSRFDTGIKYKNVVTAAGAETQTFYSNALDPDDQNQYDKLKAKRGDIGGQVRITLTYYFK